ncbi:MAG: nodulation protein NfeD [Vicinamibacterales bacterium]
MNACLARRFTGSVALVLGLALTPEGPFASHTVQAEAPVVYSAVVDSIIQPVSAEYMAATLDRADEAGAALVVFTLRTPGGLVDSTRAIITHMVAAKTPVAVFVAPSGARAASAGFILTIAADIAAMAPGTHIGAAHPVDGSGQKVDETMAAKMTEDVSAYVRTLATRRHRNVTLAEEAVTKSRAFTEDEARSATPPLVDIVAPDLPDLLRQLDGRSVTRFDGTTTTLHTAGATVVDIEMTLRQRVLSTIANPTVAYLLMSLGTLAITIELWNPGAIVPGIVGGLCLLLAFYAFSVLPVNIAGVLLLFFGLLLLVLEIKVTSFGLLTAGGVLALVFGSMILVDSPLPELQLQLRLVLPVVLTFTTFAVVMARLALRAQLRPPATGASAMVGESGIAVEPIDGERGLVSTHGELWRATAPEPIPSGSRVRVTRVDGLHLHVRKD